MSRLSRIYPIVCCLLVALPACAQQGEFVIHKNVRLVEVYASVFDQKGRYLDGLTRDRFRLADDGSPQPILLFESNAADLSCALLLDTTASMTRALPSVKNAVIRVIDQLRPADSVAVYAFDTAVRTIQEFTTDKDAAKRSMLRTRASGSTALFDALAEVAAEIAERPGKKVLIVFTDGDDNASMLNASAATDRAKKAGIPIYAIAQGEALSEPSLLRELRQIAAYTGGRAYEVQRPRDVEVVFSDISNDMLHIYMLAYKPPPAVEKKWHNIRVSVSGMKDYKVRARAGYLPE